jgi:glycosyltransferase involved in cell wall biosynthesis
VIPFGIDVNIFRPEPRLKDTTVIRIGTVKALTAKCGIDLLMQAFAKVRKMCEFRSLELTSKLRLLIVGDGPERGSFEALARELSIDKVVEFTGHVSHTEVPKYLRCLDIYAAMSRSESFGVAVLEASACEIPVVVSNVGGLPEVVEDGKTGCVVESENVTMAARVLLRLIEDPAQRACMGKAGRQRVLDHYQWTTSVTRMEEVYARVLRRKML